MKDFKQSIGINKPINEVFDFTLNPKNTPKWVDFITEEETSEWPPKLGTIYRNRGTSGSWSEYIVSEFEPSKTFTLSKKNSPYHVRYKFKAISEDKYELEYYEWVDNGILEDPFSLTHLTKLKDIMEANEQ